MNVQMIHVTLMPHVTILMEATYVNATLDSQEMGHFALVSLY